MATALPALRAALPHGARRQFAGRVPRATASFSVLAQDVNRRAESSESSSLTLGLAAVSATTLFTSRALFAPANVSPARCSEAASSATLAAQSASDGLPQKVEMLPADLRSKLGKDGNEVRLFQFESCPFCRKVRSCLDYRRIPYEIVEVEPLGKKETKQVISDYKKVPILNVNAADGNSYCIIESKQIITALLGDDAPPIAKVPAPTSTPSTGIMWTDEYSTGSVEEQWVTWTDKVLVQCIVLNVYRTYSEAAETFKYLLTHPEFPWLVRQAGAFSGTAVMYMVANRRTKKYKVDNQRAALYEALDLFATAVKEGGGKFMGGSKPGVVDFNVYGILRSAEGMQTERDVYAECPMILGWYDAMHEVIGSSCAKNPTARG